MKNQLSKTTYNDIIEIVTHQTMKNDKQKLTPEQIVTRNDYLRLLDEQVQWEIYKLERIERRERMRIYKRYFLAGMVFLGLVATILLTGYYKV